MAALKPGKQVGTWLAYYWDRAKKGQVWVPREVTNTWEGLPRQVAQERLDEWVAANGPKQVRARKRSVLGDDAIKGYIDAFIEERTALGGTEPETVQNIRTHLETYVKEYFVQVHGCKDVRQWWKLTPGFTTWLRSKHKDRSIGTSRKICQNLRRFGEYLAEATVIPQPWLIKLPKRKKTEVQETPLPRAIKPEEVLKVAGKLRGRSPKWALAVLLGYFASLRPQEVYGLARGDFITGDKAKREAKTHKRLSEHKLGSGLSVAISKARRRQGQRNSLKTAGSFGVVNVWSLEGAQAIGALLDKAKPGMLFGDDKRADLDAEWTEKVLPLLGVTLYDLRRASCLYLGREKGLDPFLLQDHMRHSSMTTTLLYTRRPKEEQEEAGEQDFSNVG